MDPRTEQMYELMRKESNRLKTFQMYPPWPKDYVDIKKLAKAGFFYTFIEDNVHCAFCRGQVCRWDRDDDPMTEHARHFTTCPFVMGGEVGNVPIGEDPIPGPKRPRPWDVCGRYANFPSGDPRYEEEQRNLRVDQTEQRQVEQPQEPHNLQTHVATSLEPQLPHQGAPISQPLDEDRTQSPRLQVPTTDPQVPTDEQNRARNRLLIYQQLRNQYSDTQPQQPSSVTNFNQSSEQATNLTNGLCKICYTNAIELVFLPCGHSVSCLSCAQRLHDCPFCRITISSRIRTYII